MIGLRDLVVRFTSIGRVEAIVLRPSRRGPAVFAQQALAEPGRGLTGDHRSQRLRTDEVGTQREITLIQHEHLPLIAAWCGLSHVDPRGLRRNRVVSGVNLIAGHALFADLALVWRVGQEVRIEITGACAPCSRMEAELGPGGYNTLRGHGGVTARLIRGGPVRVGDAFEFDHAESRPG